MGAAGGAGVSTGTAGGALEGSSEQAASAPSSTSPAITRRWRKGLRWADKSGRAGHVGMQTPVQGVAVIDIAEVVDTDDGPDVLDIVVNRSRDDFIAPGSCLSFRAHSGPIMWLLIVEALAALLLLIGLVWWTMFSGRRRGERPAEGGDDAGVGGSDRR